MKKRYRRWKIAQLVFFLLSVLSCLAPIIVAAFKTVPYIKTTESKLALGGVTIFFCGIIALIVFRSLIAKFIHKIPYTITVLFAVIILFAMLSTVKLIIDDAIAVLLIGVIGAGAGVILELCSMFCRFKADEIKDFYYRRVVNNNETV